MGQKNYFLIQVPKFSLFALASCIHSFKHMCYLSVFSYSYNVSGTGRLSLEELKVMMEKLGAPQTHLGLKEMIKVT